MRKSILIFAILALCLTQSSFSVNMRGSGEKEDRELTQIASNVNLGNLGTLIGDLIGAIKNSTATTISSSTATASNSTNTSSNNSSASTNTTTSATNSSSGNSSSTSTNNSSTSNTSSSTNSSSSTSSSATNATNVTSATTTTTTKTAKNDVDMTTFPQDCLDVHNAERALVNVSNLTWSDSLAASAQTWAQYMADNSVFEHSGKTGENIADSTYSTKTLSRLLGLWTKEKAWFIVGCTYPDCSSNGDEVGHYTQMVWAKTTEVGCGFAPGKSFNYLCCQYYKAGNVIGQTVYPLA